jgi:hypothetical protein
MSKFLQIIRFFYFTNNDMIKNMQKNMLKKNMLNYVKKMYNKFFESQIQRIYTMKKNIDIDKSTLINC